MKLYWHGCCYIKFMQFRLFGNLLFIPAISEKQPRLLIIDQYNTLGDTTKKKSSVGLLGVLFAIIISVMVFGFFIQEAAAEPAEQQLLVDKARVTFDTFMKDENQAWLQENLNQSKGLSQDKGQME